MHYECLMFPPAYAEHSGMQTWICALQTCEPGHKAWAWPGVEILTNVSRVRHLESWISFVRI